LPTLLVIDHVPNLSLNIYQTYTKFIFNKNLKFSPAYTILSTTSFQSYMINSCCDQCIIKKLLNFSFHSGSNRFINHWKIQPSNTSNCIFISFGVHCIIALYNSCFAVCKFLLHSLHKGYTTPAESGFVSHANSICHSFP